MDTPVTTPTAGPTPSLAPTQVALGSVGGTAGVTLPNGQPGTISVPAAVAAFLTADQQISVSYDPVPATTSDAQRGSLGGGNTIPVSPPVDIQVNVVSTTTGQPVPGTSALGSLTVQVCLPVVAEASGPGQTFAWLVEVRQDGQFFGYQRLPAQFDAANNTACLGMPLSGMQGTLFLPAIITPAYVQNWDPTIHIWSSPGPDAADFGGAGPQYTTFTVVAPQIGSRIYVYNAASQNYGWIDAAGVGPVAAP